MRRAEPVRILMVGFSESEYQSLVSGLESFRPVTARPIAVTELSRSLGEDWQVALIGDQFDQGQIKEVCDILVSGSKNLPVLMINRGSERPGSLRADLSVGVQDFVPMDDPARLALAIERELSAARTASLLDLTSDAILLLDGEGRLDYCNQAAARYFAINIWEQRHNLITDLIGGEQRGSVIEALAAVQSGQQPLIELNVRTEAGQQIILECRWLSERTGEGLPTLIKLVCRDITERKRLAYQFAYSQRMESISMLAGGVAHDLNNVLAPVLMAIQILRREIKSGPVELLLHSLAANTERGSHLVRQILSFVQGMEGERLPLQVKYLLQCLEKTLKQQQSPSIQISINMPEEHWQVRADPTLLNQALLSVCRNACEAMPAGGKLTIFVENVTVDENYAAMYQDARVGRYVLINVTDNGTGLPPELREKVFEPFFTTKASVHATGLGLTEALNIIRSHGGFINLYSEVGKGTQCKIYLPAHDGSMVTDVEPQPGLPIGQGELILVVDDEPTILHITKETLEEFGYQTITAADGTEAVALFAERKDEVQAVIIDMMMPYMDGPATIRALLKLAPEIKIIATSGLVSRSRVSEALSQGVRAFIMKPYTAEQLLNTIHEVLHGNA